MLFTCKQLWEILSPAAAEPLVEAVSTLTDIKHNRLSYISLCKWDVCICLYMGRFGFSFKGQFAAKSVIVSPAVSVGIRLHGKWCMNTSEAERNNNENCN